MSGDGAIVVGVGIFRIALDSFRVVVDRLLPLPLALSNVSAYEERLPVSRVDLDGPVQVLDGFVEINAGCYR